MRVCSHVVLVALLAVVSTAQETEPASGRGPVFRAESELVLVDVSVRDRDGNLARDLNQDDFRVWEDGKEQTITSFSFESAGLDPATAPPSYLVFYFDGSSISPNDMTLLKSSFEEFVESHASPDRYMAVLEFVLGVRILQNFTTRPEPLREAVASVQGAMSPANFPRRTSTSDSTARQVNSIGSGSDYLFWLRSLRAVADSLGAIRGRKTLLLISNGRSGSETPAEREELSDLLQAWNRANVSVYAVVPRRGTIGREASAIISVEPMDDTSWRAGRYLNQPPDGRLNAALMSMVSETGGGMINDTEQLGESLADVAEEQSAYYVLGYVPPEAPDGSCHALRVRVNGRGLEARSRNEYCSDRPADALAGTSVGRSLEERATGESEANLPATAQVAHFYGSGSVARVSVAMEMGLGGTEFRRVRGRQHAELNIVGVAADASGSVAARFSETVNLDFENRQEAEAFVANPVHYENQFEIAPGEYTLRIAFSAGDERFGRAESPLVVEPWDGRSLALSGILFSTQARQAEGLTLGLDSELLAKQSGFVAGQVEVIPAGNNRCRKSGPCFAYVEIYEPLLAGVEPPEVVLEMNIVDAQAEEVVSAGDSASVASLIRPGNPVVPVILQVPVNEAQLDAGRYRLEVRVTHSADDGVALRTANFEVE